MAQNVYDNPTFFTTYSRLLRSQKGHDGAPEWPTLRSMIQDISGARVLDLGCGYGWFCRWAVKEAGASYARGIDISERMLARAREIDNTTSTTGIEYERADLDQVQLQEDSFELVYSSLAFHYLGDLERLFGAVSRALKVGGRFVFSVEHPVYTAPVKEEWKASADGKEDKESWLLNRYRDEGPRTRNWLGEDVRKYHRTIQTYFSLLGRSGLVLLDLVEWMPSDKDLEKHPDWNEGRHRPMFLLIGAQKVKA